jgi:hypothetical protein
VHESFSSKVERRDTKDRSRREDRRIEVQVILGPDGQRQVILQDLSHGPGVGWYVQKTIRLDREQVDALLRELCCARQSTGPASFPCPDPPRSCPEGGARIIEIERLLKS